MNSILPSDGNTHRIHVCYIYGNMDPINIPPNVSIYASTMDPMGCKITIFNEAFIKPGMPMAWSSPISHCGVDHQFLGGEASF